MRIRSVGRMKLLSTVPMIGRTPEENLYLLRRARKRGGVTMANKRSLKNVRFLTFGDAKK